MQLQGAPHIMSAIEAAHLSLNLFLSMLYTLHLYLPFLLLYLLCILVHVADVHLFLPASLRVGANFCFAF